MVHRDSPTLQARFPAVAAELDSARSGFAADQVSYGSKKLAWWQCPHGHEYAMTVNQRTHARRPQACPYCAGKRVTPERSLAAVSPAVAAELDVVASGITAAELAPQSNRRVWWQCSTDPAHRWQATPNNRVGRGSGCPYCSGARASNSNRLSFSSPHAHLLAEWDYERNGPLTPHDVSVGSSRKVWWVCGKAPDHRWEATISKRTGGQGCPFCAGNRVSPANSLTSRPEVACELDVEASGVTADQLSIGSSKIVTWKCSVDDSHVWQASVANRTGGNGRRGTGCPYCRLAGTSQQELQLKAELAAVLPVELNRSAVPDSQGKPVLADIVINDEPLELRVIVEFDGFWWHNKPEDHQRDARKTQRLQEAGWVVIRVREHLLPLITGEFDVAVELLAPATTAASAVLDRLVTLGLIPATTAHDYRQRTAEGPVNVELARKLIRDRLGRERADDQSHEGKWNRMYDALGSFASEHGHCKVPEDAEVAGANLARWAYKQRTLYRQGTLLPERAERLQAIPGWSFESPHIEGFWAAHDSYLEAVDSDADLKPRSAVVWASNLRARREQLQARGQDLPSYQLAAMAEIPGWQWKPSEEGFEAKLLVLQKFIADTGKTISDIRQRDTSGQHKVGTWINSWRTRRDQLTEQQRDALEQLPGWTWHTRADRWDERLQELEKFARCHGHARPSLTSYSDHERSLASWKRNNKNRLRGKNDDRARKLRDLLARYNEELP